MLCAYNVYVDDSGTPSLKDDTSYYVISGVIMHIQDLHILGKKFAEFKKKYFVSNYKKDEIHVHEIYHGRNNFSELTLGEKYKILSALYNIINTMPFTAITVGIHKQGMEDQYPQWDIFNAAWTFMIERYDMFLSDYSDPLGNLVIDESENFIQGTTVNILKDIFENGTNYKKINNINQEFSFFPSHNINGLQLADCISYCTLKALNTCDKFRSYWDITKSKLRNRNGNIRNNPISITELTTYKTTNDKLTKENVELRDTIRNLTEKIMLLTPIKDEKVGII